MIRKFKKPKNQIKKHLECRSSRHAVNLQLHLQRIKSTNIWGQYPKMCILINLTTQLMNTYNRTTK